FARQSGGGYRCAERLVLLDQRLAVVVDHMADAYRIIAPAVHQLPPLHVRQQTTGNLYRRLALVVRHSLALRTAKDDAAVKVGPSAFGDPDPLQRLDRPRSRAGVEADQDEARQMVCAMVAASLPLIIGVRPGADCDLSPSETRP